MIVPSIDLRGGEAVQLVQGREQKLSAGDPTPLAKQFGLIGEISVIDLDAALGTGNQVDQIVSLCRLASCRVGGGIRSLEQAQTYLNAGASKIILGTAAEEPWVRQLPRSRVIVALDAYQDEVMVRGWREGTGATVLDKLQRLRSRADEFLITVIEREGRMQGLDFDRVSAWNEAANGAKLTIAGGIATTEEVAVLDRAGMDAQIGMALYTGKWTVADALAAMLSSDRSDGRWPTTVVDESGRSLGLAYSDKESLRCAIEERRGVYSSRTRGLWRKGETSGNSQELLQIRLDCDRDTLQFQVRQNGSFCHRGTQSCFGFLSGLGAVQERLRTRRWDPIPNSYTQSLFKQPGLLNDKLREEAEELTQARTRADVIHEAADVLYFTMVKMIAAGVSLEDVEHELQSRSLRVTRRDGSGVSS